ncbi:hypothetical protein Tco_1014384 [Tanacetum coccineum]
MTLSHSTEKCPRPKRLQDSDYFKDKMLLMQAQENGAVLDEEQLLFLVGEQVTNFDNDVDDPNEKDLALNVDHIFEADQCDAFDSDVDFFFFFFKMGPNIQTMFMVNLSSEDPIYDEVGPSYDSNTPFKVHDHDTFVDHMDEYHEVHEMQNDVQHNYVVDSDVEYTSHNDMMNHGCPSMSTNKQVKVVNDTLTSELERYKELVGVYEKRTKFELTEREQKIDEQMRINYLDQNNYSKENYLAIFAPQRDLTPEQIFWAKDENDRKKVEASVLKPLSTPTVYPPNTPVKLVPRVLQRGKEVLSKRKDVTSLKLFHFSKILKEVKEMEEIFDQMNNEVDKNTVDKQCAEIGRKNLLIAYENLIAVCC